VLFVLTTSILIIGLDFASNGKGGRGREPFKDRNLVGKNFKTCNSFVKVIGGSCQLTSICEECILLCLAAGKFCFFVRKAESMEVDGGPGVVAEAGGWLEGGGAYDNIETPYTFDDFNVEENDDMVDLDSEDDEYEVDSTAGWIRVLEKNHGDVKIRFDPLQRSSLHVAHEEITGVLKALKGATHTPSEKDLSPRAVFAYFLTPLARHFLKHVNQVLSRANEPMVTAREIVQFLRVEVAIAWYQHSPTHLAANRAAAPDFARVFGDGESYRKIIMCLSKPMYEHVDFQVDEGIEELEKLLSNTSRVCWVKGISVIALDDDKLRIKAKSAATLKIVVKKIGKCFGPVFHTLASVVTGLWLGGYIEKLSDTTDVIFEVLFRRLEGAEHISNVDLKRTMITMDRGYTTKQGIEAVVKLGAEVHGTRKKGNDFPFTYNKAKPAPAS